MTVRDWIDARVAAAPSSLRHAILAAVGDNGHEGAEHAPDACLEAAARSLDDLLAGQRFSREHALQLLAIDALTTLAFEHAGQSRPSADALAERARAGAERLSRRAI